MKRVGVLVFGAVSYLLFFATFVYTVGFLADFGAPKTVDGPVSVAPWLAVSVNLLLFAVFGLQHSVMARPAFKLTRFVPPAAERSNYVLFTVLALALLYALWQPIPGTLWHVESEPLRTAIWALYLAGFGLVFYATLLISHFDLFGLRQVVLFARGREYTHLPFATPSLYRYVRHPLYVGWFIAFWATPTMTFGHLLFATACTVYILVALSFEERDLVSHFGERYRRYREQVPAFVPAVRTRRSRRTVASHG